jgi:curved DNA-binding protein CbpA
MNPYEVLGVRPTSTDAEIRRAYVALARRFHPDLHGGADDRMREVNEAWAVLGDVRKRADFDRSQRRDPPPDPGFRPHDIGDDGFDPRDLADVPYRARPPKQRAQLETFTFIPVLVFAIAVTTSVFGYFFDSQAIIGIGVVLFSAACVALVVVLLVAMADARRDEG